MNSLTSREFWADCAERAVKTAAQAAIGVLGTGAVGLLQIDWANVGSVTLMAALISVLTSIASAGGDTVSPASLVAKSGDHAYHTTDVDDADLPENNMTADGIGAYLDTDADADDAEPETADDDMTLDDEEGDTSEVVD